MLDKPWVAGNQGIAVKAYGKLGPAGSGSGEITLPSGTWDTDYYVYVLAEKVNDGNATDYASEPVKVTKKAQVSRTVTFKVKNGSWDDGTAADQTVTLTGYEGDELKLEAGQIPGVGTMPADGYETGSWDTTPSASTAITADTTYTYTYKKKAPDPEPDPEPDPDPTPSPEPTPTSKSSKSSSSKTVREERVGGSTRYDTMASLVSKGFSSSKSAVVASGASFADALAASALAGAYGCPVVLTDPASLSSQASSLVGSLGVSDVTVVGGPSAVSDAVAGQLGATRVDGDDRYATAVETMLAVRAIDASSNTVVVATGGGFADALSIGPWAWSSKSPILLALPDGTLRQDVIDAIKADAGFSRVVLVGGASVVSNGVKSQLGEDYEYVRLAGADRYATSAEVATWSAANGLGWSKPAVATGHSYADALSAAAACGKNGSVLLLADSASDPALALLKDNSSKVTCAYVLGGEVATSAALESAVRSALR